jgi:signal transduction histidine kinase
LLALAGYLVVVLIVAELLLQPAPSERAELVAILAIPALAAAAAVKPLGRWVAKRRRVATAALAVGLCSFTIAALASVVASNRMFVTSHDFRLFLVMTILAGGIALLVGRELTRPLAADIRRLERVATAVASGDLTARTGIERADEVGATAQAIDTMIDRLAESETSRRRVESARQHLLSGVGHDLRTPLAALRSAVESLQDGVAPDPDRYLNVAAAQVDAISTLVDQLFQYARLEAGAPITDWSTVSVTEIADEAVEAVTPLADRCRVKVTLDADGAATLVGSPSGLSRVFRNLLDNAVRHAADGIVNIEIQDGPATVEIRVRDTGPGFPGEFREMAFEPFTRGDPARNADGSSGLGLAIVKAIVDIHQGEVWIGDGPGGDVGIRLPSTTPLPIQV